MQGYNIVGAVMCDENRFTCVGYRASILASPRRIGCGKVASLAPFFLRASAAKILARYPKQFSLLKGYMWLNAGFVQRA